MIEASAVRMATTRRFLGESQAAQKVALLARLQRRHIECRLPQESESRVEQSFNEQLFAKVLGYRTLLSHDALPYHLRPKNYAASVRRYDDFSLGTFWGDARDVVLATAEFKDPGTDLDAPQTDRKERISPIDQAFRAAAGFSTCRWVIVSNFRELRLYDVTEMGKPLGVFDLHETRTPRQLGAPCAHFDHGALIGTKGTPEMAIALNPKHPSAPLPWAQGHFRLLGTFTPTGPLDIRLTQLYDTTRAAVFDVLKPHHNGGWTLPPETPTDVADGWCVMETGNARIAASVEGQIRCSIRRVRTDTSVFLHVAHDIYKFLMVVEQFYSRIHPQVKAYPGAVSVELCEIQLLMIYFQGSLAKDDEMNGGRARKDELFSGDLRWEVHKDPAGCAADLMGELALQFQSDDGRRVRFNHGGLAQILRETP